MEKSSVELVFEDVHLSQLVFLVDVEFDTLFGGERARRGLLKALRLERLLPLYIL